MPGDPTQKDKRPECQVRTLTALALVGQLGFVVALCIVGGVLAGVYVDRWVGGSGFLLIGFILLGIGAGVYGAYRILAKEIK